MIKINDLAFYYQQSDFRLNIPHLSVKKGTKIAIVGASGLVSRSFRHPQYAASGVPTVQGLQKVSDLGGEKLKTPA